MSRSIRLGKTKQERQIERRRLGKLSNNLVSTSTELRYHEAFDAFVKFTRSSNEDLWKHPLQVDEFMCSYIENLWESGEAKSCANYTVAAVQYMKPQLKKQLPLSWKLISTWNKLEQPCRATPLDPPTAMSIAGIFIQWQWPRLGYLCMVGFSGFLRTGKMFKLIKRHVVSVPNEGRPSVPFLEDTKTAQRNHLLWEKVLIQSVLIHDKVAKLCLHELCRGLGPDDPLCDVHPAKFRALWKQMMIHLKMENQGYTPYSLRRGGATSAYRLGAHLDELLIKGRWKHQSTTRIYLDQALQELGSLQIPAASRPLLSQGTRVFHTAISQMGTRGGKRG